MKQINWKIGASKYIGIRIRKPDGSYVILDQLSSIVCVITFANCSKLICRTTPKEGELPIRRLSNIYYYIKVPGDITLSKNEGLGSVEFGTVAEDADITTFRSIADKVAIRFHANNIGGVL